MLKEIVGFLCFIFTLFFLVNSIKTRKQSIAKLIKKLLIYLIILTALKYTESLNGALAVLMFIVINNEYLEK